VQVSSSGSGIPARVVVVEPTGAETELLVRVGDADLVVLMHGRTAARPDDIVHLEVQAGSTHVFDSAGGERLDGPPGRLQ
jgi:multiple sugar transport system ATP-binding protein